MSAKRFEAEPKLTRHDYRDDFENCFKEAQEKNYYIEIADDAQKLLYWFTVFTGKGIFRHEIKMGDYNNLSREQLRAQGFMPHPVLHQP